MSSEDITDIIIEAIEVFINHILFLRNLYPQRIFKKCRVYNVPAYVCTFPALKSYIHNVLRSARELQKCEDLQSVTLHFYHEELPINEYYTFQVRPPHPIIEIDDQLETAPSILNGKFFIDFEEQLRAFLYNLSERLKALHKLPKGAKFRIIVNTTQYAFVRFSQNPHYQDFPWLCETLNTKEERKPTTILPLTHLDAIGLRLILEQFN